VPPAEQVVDGGDDVIELIAIPPLVWCLDEASGTLAVFLTAAASLIHLAMASLQSYVKALHFASDPGKPI
jgi:hypothetical protein